MVTYLRVKPRDHDRVIADAAQCRRQRPLILILIYIEIISRDPEIIPDHEAQEK